MKYIITALSLICSLNLFGQLSIDEKVDSVLSLMSLDEKIGQMAQVEKGELTNANDIATFGLGSLLSGGGSAPASNTVTGWADMYDNFQDIALQSNLRIPLIYGIDAVHGHNNVYGAVLFPHNIGVGCTWNAALVREVNQIVAKEVAATGIDWTFAPCIAVPRNERWGRTYEGFGETAELQKMMAKESVLGLQGTDLGLNETILACAKHFVGDGGTSDGIDQGNTQLSEEILREVHMAGYIDAIEAGVGSIMASYNSWNGEKLHRHEYLLTTVLKNELGFEGFVVSDWKGVDQVDEDYREAIKRAVNAGIDMVMVPDRYEIFIGHLKDLVQNNEVSINRINDAVKRILRQKFLLDLFKNPYSDNTLRSLVGSAEHRAVARQAVRESMVLLTAKNDVLPLNKNNQKILVAGSIAADLGAQCGGWSIYWQGSNGNITTGTNVLQGIQKLAETSEIVYSESGDYEGDIDVAVVVVGEKTPYAEGAGDRSSLNLDRTDVNLIKKIKEKGIPVIAVLISGRPLIIGEMLPYSDAIIAAWLPGTEGDGIAEVLFGDYTPTGKLSHSWPKNMDQVPINYGDNSYSPLFEYKHGWQYFPTSDSSESVLPFSAVTSNDGNSILLALSDYITTLNYESSDFEMIVDNSSVSTLISSVNISDFDNSILNISLNQSLKETNSIEISYSGNGVISGNDTLVVFNNYYVHNAVGQGGAIFDIPGKVEAEDYIEMSGIQTEACSDDGNGLNVGYIESGDWMKYNINVTQEGLYNLRARISGYNEGILSIIFNDSIEASLNYLSTNGWQNWQDFSTEIYLQEGNNEMLVKARSNAFNINYFDFSLVNSIRENIISISEISVFPNPVESELNINFKSDYNQHVSIKLINISGSIIKILYTGTTDQDLNRLSFTLDNDLTPGIYFIEVKDKNKRYFKKILIK
ncbi:MAG: hypothetical protein C0597_12775 [Marinilabiliales bacterium]|nr:MAG: hypothetical protein C0597_12775 [Marinilabiliales bacterium]